ncbi:hypothetical protein [uncultured Fenollaria sp.]|uniref:hypothetical protein n=1 Tax=uncultured Fenollaria sp. TaxID=1686315 RepID=UPI002600CB98|nr:hypothetical protein [uncultured Fenollaria sp.]
MIIKMLMGLVKVIFMIIFFPIVLLVSLFNDDNDTKHKKVKKQAKKDELAWIDRLEELDALIDD